MHTTRPRAAPWVGRILQVDLSTGTTSILSPFPHVYSLLGGRGLAVRLALDMIPPGMRPYDSESPLMFMPGALVGTPAPSSGRVTICGLSPQAYPDEWYTRANLGGHWGAMLKYAGYDGLIVRGKAERPAYLRIEDDQVQIVEAGDLWGRGLIETQLRLRDQLGDDWRTLAIGPAGENLCRYAVIATGTESAAGQGGFGAVMGSKNLKAIAVRGSGGVPIARPLETLRRSRLLVERLRSRYLTRLPTYRGNTPQQGEPRPAPCTYQCPGACGAFYDRVPGVVFPDRSYSGHVHCCAPRLRGGEWLGARFGLEEGFEIAQISNDLGINHWEVTFGLVPWILRSQERGELREIDGDRLDFTTPRLWVEFLNRVARREGWGDVFAEGTPRAAAILGVGEDIVGEYYPAWGQASHWDGHGSFHSPYFPFWLVTALQWAMDTRDPMGGGHGYTLNVVGLVRRIKPDVADEEVWDKLAMVGEHLYGSPFSADPRSGYRGKAAAAVFHQDRAALKDCLGICDNIFPQLTDPDEDDFLVRVDGVEGKYLEHYLFEAVSDLDLSREAFYQVGTRVFTMERLLAIRNWGRSRATDETIIPYLSHPEGSVNPYLGKKVGLDLERFRDLLSECYSLRGWDADTGRPTPQALRPLELEAESIAVTSG